MKRTAQNLFVEEVNSTYGRMERRRELLLDAKGSQIEGSLGYLSIAQWTLGLPCEFLLKRIATGLLRASVVDAQWCLVDAQWTPSGHPLDAHWTPIGRCKFTVKWQNRILKISY